MRLRVIVVFCGWLLATGVQWDAVQVVAWARMWTQNLETETPLAALATTFSPDGMCSVCETVQAVKNDPAPDALLLAKLVEKAPLVPVETSSVRLAPPTRQFSFQLHEDRCPEGVVRTPPVPPPRAVV